MAIPFPIASCRIVASIRFRFFVKASEVRIVPRTLRFFCIVLLPALFLFAQIPRSNAQNPSVPKSVQPLVLDGLGRATMVLDGPWQFHTGDNPAWAAPGFDDSNWQQIETGRAWESQGHKNYTGFAWYRRRITLPAGAGGLNQKMNWALYLLQVDSAAEVYWNGRLMGSYGKVPPNPIWYEILAPAHKIIPLGPAPAPGETVELAIRVWKAPYVFLSFPDEGGLLATPQIGSEDAIRYLVAADRIRFQQSMGFGRFLATISGIVGLIAFLVWLRHRRRRMLLWLAIALFVPLVENLLDRSFDPLPFRITYGLIGTIIELRDMAIWFLLIALLGLARRKGLVRWTIIIATVSVVTQLIEGSLQFFNWDGPLAHPLLLADVILTVPDVVLATWGIVLVVAAFRERLDAARWTLAIAALLANLVQFTADITGLGVRWTHHESPAILGYGILNVSVYPITPEASVVAFFLVALLYAAWRYMIEHSERESALEQELAQAQEVQQVLIPAQLPAVPGYTVTSAYHPAREVGGDFFQIVPLSSGRTLVVIGDVSGKGLHAAMTVSLIVGSIRSTVETTEEPAAILSALNRLLYGRLPNGFATCLALRLEADGSCTLASAGHLPPFLDGKEITLPPALPLGLVPPGLTPQAEYETARIRVASGERLTLYTDGLPEAQNGTGELFGFTRMESLLAEGRDAEGIAEAAREFGQEDDITVLTLGFSDAA
jgi:hypothetical protein